MGISAMTFHLHTTKKLKKRPTKNILKSYHSYQKSIYQVLSQSKFQKCQIQLMNLQFLKEKQSRRVTRTLHKYKMVIYLTQSIPQYINAK